VKALILTLVALGPVVPTDPEYVPTHAVMYEMDYTADFDIRHAQALGGFPTMEQCRSAMPATMTDVVTKLEPGLTPQLMCSGIHERVVIGTLPKVKT
jgi:hypothetical protein